MKKFNYEWGEDSYLIHVEFNSKGQQKGVAYEIILDRVSSCSNKILESESKKIIENSFRFIISRTSPDEKVITIKYPDNILLTVFEIDDRAYYPTEAYYEG